MPRTPQADSARENRLGVRATDTEKAMVERNRGPLSISDYLRGLVRADDARRRAATH